MSGEDFDASHLVFINDALRSLESALARIGARLTLRIGEVPAVLDEMHHDIGVARLWSHQETRNAFTYARDLRVEAWTRHSRVPWTQFLGHGVVRALESRDGWAARWHAQMNEPLVRPPNRVMTASGVARGEIATARALGRCDTRRAQAQRGGTEPARWRRSLTAFEQRLRWHCHFEHRTAYAQARARVSAVKASPAAREAAREVYRQHGSRRRSGRASATR